MSKTAVLRKPALLMQRRALAVSGGLPAQPVSAESDAASDARPSAHDAGYEAGYAAGLAQGLADAATRTNAALDAGRKQLEADAEKYERSRADAHRERVAAFEAALNGLPRALAEQAAQVEHDAIGLAYAALCRVLGNESTRAALLADLVRHALAERHGQSVLAVRLHSADLQALTSDVAGAAVMAACPAVQWKADAALQRGDCVLDSEHGQVDVGLWTQLESLRLLWNRAAAARAESSMEHPA